MRDASLRDGAVALRDGADEGVRIASAAAVDLQRLYGRRLRGVLLFGSWARGEADAESDVDLLVILDRFAGGFYSEVDRLSDALYERGLVAGRVIQAVPTTADELSTSREEVLVAARSEAIAVT